jgi:DNA-binding LacI/PurR family transcriptional regulator
MSATITDIARLAGVAPSTVSRALQDHPRISMERREAIKALAAELGYRPSEVARSLVTGRTHTLGVVVTDVTDPFVAEVMRGAEAASREAGYTLLFAMSNRAPAQELEAIRVLLRREVDGLIVVSGRAGTQYTSLRVHEGHDWPLVLVNHKQDGSGIFSVCMDNRHGIRTAVSHVTGLGHRRLAYISGPERGRSSSERLAAFREAVESLPIEAAHIVEGEGTLEDGARALENLLALSLRPTAVLCYNDLTALGFLGAAARTGIHVSADFSVVGFDDIPLSAHSSPPLTTIRQPTTEIGRSAVALALAALAGEAPPDRVLQGELILRASTAAPALT